MKVRRRFGILLVLIAIGLISGCGLFRREPAAIDSLTLTDQVDERTKQAVRPLNGFPATATQFFASVKVLNAGKGTKVTARWLYEGKLVDEWPLVFQDADGDRFVAFNLVHRDSQPFPPGSYRVEILLDGKLVKQQDFNVQ